MSDDEWLRKLVRERADLKPRIAALESRVRELEAALAALSSYVGNGLGTEGVTTAEQYEARIRDGIDRITGVEATRREKAESERDTLRAECDRLRGLVREAVAGLNAAWGLIDGFYPAHRRDYAALVARLGAE